MENLLGKNYKCTDYTLMSKSHGIALICSYCHINLVVDFCSFSLLYLHLYFLLFLFSLSLLFPFSFSLFIFSFSFLTELLPSFHLSLTFIWCNLASLMSQMWLVPFVYISVLLYMYNTELTKMCTGMFAMLIPLGKANALRRRTAIKYF